MKRVRLVVRPGFDAPVKVSKASIYLVLAKVKGGSLVLREVK
jgi:hypothetical protein